MDEEIERLIVSVRADTQGFARDVAAMKSELDGPLGEGVSRAGRIIESTLSRALLTGRLGFEDLGKVALSVLADIANAAIRSGLNALGGGSSGGDGGSGSIGGGGLLSLVTALFGVPGRATGGPVSPGRAYVVGERGPELFVPTSSGTVAASPGGGARDVRVAITINAPAAAAPDVLGRSSRQVARAVRAALSAE